MSSVPNKNLNEDGGNESGNVGNTNSSALKQSHDDKETQAGNSGKVVAPIRQDYRSSHDVGQDQVPKIVPLKESRDADGRSPSRAKLVLRIPISKYARSEQVGSKDSMKIDNRKSQSKDDGKEAKHERDSSSGHKSDMKLDKGVYSVSNSQFGLKNLKEQHPLKQRSDGPGGSISMSRTSFLGLTEAAKGGLLTESRNLAELARENKFDMKGDDKSREKYRKKKEMKHGDWVEWDDDRGNISLVGGSSGENKGVQKESGKGVFEMNDTLKDKERLQEKEKIHIKRKSLNVSDKVVPHSEKEVVGVPGRSAEQEISISEPKKKDDDTLKNVEREARDRKEQVANVESERPDKRGKFHEKEPDKRGMKSGVDAKRERTLTIGVQKQKRLPRTKDNPQRGNRGMRIRPHSNDNEGSQGKIQAEEPGCFYYYGGRAEDATRDVYKNGVYVQEMIKLWTEHEQSQADKSFEGSPTLEIRIPAEHVTSSNRQVRGGQLWGTDVYTVDSDLVAGYYLPTASPPPPATQELRATVRVLPPQDRYISTLRNNVRSRAWGAAVACSFCVERCCILKIGGGIVEIKPCLTHLTTTAMEPTIAPAAEERTMTRKAAATNALHEQRLIGEVSIMFNHCNEPWLKYNLNAVADKGCEIPLFTSARLKQGEVIYVESHYCRYELCFSGEKVVANGEGMNIDDEINVVNVFRWSRFKRPIPQRLMHIFGIPLSPEHVEVIADGLEWEDINWSQTGVWIAGKEYRLFRISFLSTK